MSFKSIILDKSSFEDIKLKDMIFCKCCMDELILFSDKQQSGYLLQKQFIFYESQTSVVL